MVKRKEITKSWQTTAYGIIGGLLILLTQIKVLFDGDAETNLSSEQTMTAISALAMSVGLIKARDHGVSSEEAS